MIVVDTNVIAYLLIQGDKTPLAQAVWQQDSAWAVPSLWRHEFLNVLATYARRGGASLEEMEQVWQHSQALLLRREHQADMESALRLAVQHDISAYDAQYIALAQQLDINCVTEDSQLLRAFHDTAISMTAFCQTA